MQNFRVRLAVLAFAVSLLPSLVVRAEPVLLLEGSFEKSFENGTFGPFYSNEKVSIIGTVRNTSATEAVSICPGVCVGDGYTYSLGGLASIPAGYDFFFGNSPASLESFDGQLVGTLAPLDAKDFVFGVYTPERPHADAGMYSFFTQLQIFAATAERPMLGSASFGGTWEVISRVPEPSTLPMVLAAVGLLLGQRHSVEVRRKKPSPGEMKPAKGVEG